jgi:hypothetical protein
LALFSQAVARPLSGPDLPRLSLKPITQSFHWPVGKQTFDNGQKRYAAATLWGTHVNTKWGCLPVRRTNGPDLGCDPLAPEMCSW